MNINDAAEEVIALARGRVQRAGAAIRSELSADLPVVFGDRVQLQQVMVNLLVNAAESMDDVRDRPREVVLRTLVEPGAIRIEVQDAGVGVSPEHRKRIFRPFHTTKSAGMGMGLSICTTIVERHQGNLDVRANDGPGSTFHFSIPLWRAPD